MKAIKNIYLFFLPLLFLECSSQNIEIKDIESVEGVKQNPKIALSQFNKNYSFLQSNSKVKDRVFYWTTLVENDIEIRNLLETNVELSAFLEAAKKRLTSLENQNEVTAAQYANSLKFSDAERVAISTAIKKIGESNTTTFINFSNNHIGPSGAFNQFQEITNVAKLNQLIVQEMLLGINQIINTYVAGIDPRFPDSDRVSYDVNSKQYKLLLKNLVTELNINKQQYNLFYQPFLNFALGALNLNNRDEAGRYTPLRDGENVKVYEYVQTIKWEDFKYSMIVVLGDAPNSPLDLPNISIGGMERCDYAVTLFNQGIAPIIAFSGGNVAPFQTQYFEAIEMKKYVMKKFGIPENKIMVDPHARHTTTNMRNIGRLIFKYGIPDNKKALLCTIKSQSNYVSVPEFETRCMIEMKHIPMQLHDRLSDRDIEFTPKIKTLHIDSSDPLDP
jgi:hypothetical protein